MTLYVDTYILTNIFGGVLKLLHASANQYQVHFPLGQLDGVGFTNPIRGACQYCQSENGFN